jgi:hypothetical protein
MSHGAGGGEENAIRWAGGEGAAALAWKKAGKLTLREDMTYDQRVKADSLTWSDPIRVAHTADGGDCGYPESVQRADG